ncbi:Os01g0265600 [Oryza sativa Japonica Group]|uniref:Os01g0265600 protein n=1 Tax=Oryza sativa subsp. japonica TaxID=39947 RepID=A0A0P0V0X0_ORYSJ|nr:Os01g0265600 [Oryza sativa Japonica Group]
MPLFQAVPCLVLTSRVDGKAAVTEAALRRRRSSTSFDLRWGGAANLQSDPVSPPSSPLWSPPLSSASSSTLTTSCSPAPHRLPLLARRDLLLHATGSTTLASSTTMTFAIAVERHEVLRTSSLRSKSSDLPAMQK